MFVYPSERFRRCHGRIHLRAFVERPAVHLFPEKREVLSPVVELVNGMGVGCRVADGAAALADAGHLGAERQLKGGPAHNRLFQVAECFK